MRFKSKKKERKKREIELGQKENRTKEREMIVSGMKARVSKQSKSKSKCARCNSEA